MVIHLKIKIPSIFEDYIVDLKKYYKKILKNTRKIIRKTKFTWHNIKYNYEQKIPVKNKYIKASGIIIMLLIVNLLLNKTILPSFAIYQNEHDFSLIGAKIGGNKYDYSLLIYLEDSDSAGKGNGSYSLTDNIPMFGYEYTGYSCQNKSVLTYDDETKNTEVTLKGKDVCSIYFNYSNSYDISTVIMLEDEVNSEIYSETSQIPYYGYRYSHYECANNSKLEYNEELHNVTIASGQTDFCKIYFKKDITDIEIKLYLETNYQSGEYTQSNSILANKKYKLNEENTVCLNNNEERINANISYESGYINISSEEIAYCKVYLEIEND